MDRGPSPGISKKMKIIWNKHDQEYVKIWFLRRWSGSRAQKCDKNMKIIWIKCENNVKWWNHIILTCSHIILILFSHFVSMVSLQAPALAVSASVLSAWLPYNCRFIRCSPSEQVPVYKGGVLAGGSCYTLDAGVGGQIFFQDCGMDRGPSPGISNNMKIMWNKYDQEYVKIWFLRRWSGSRAQKCDKNMKII